MDAPRTQRAVSCDALPRPARDSAFCLAPSSMLLDFKSKWFQSYCRAVMESEPDAARIYIRDAFIDINDRLHSPDVTASEREALSVATRYLALILRVELAKAS
jgi:hypothetical protein